MYMTKEGWAFEASRRCFCVLLPLTAWIKPFRLTLFFPIYLSMLLPWVICDNGHSWGPRAWEPFADWLPMAQPEERAMIFFVFILMETESGFEVKHLVCFGEILFICSFPLGFLMFYSVFWNKGLIWSPLDFSINASKALDQTLNTDMDFFPCFCICPLVIPSANAFCICCRVWHTLHSTFEGVSCFIVNVFPSCQQPRKYYRDNLGSWERRWSLFLGRQRQKSWWTEVWELQWFKHIAAMPGTFQLHAGNKNEPAFY